MSLTALHRLRGLARERLLPAAPTLAATSEASFTVSLRSKAALLHLPGSRGTPLLPCRRGRKVLRRLPTDVTSGLRPRKAALLRLLLRRRKIPLLVLAAGNFKVERPAIGDVRALGIDV